MKRQLIAIIYFGYNGNKVPRYKHYSYQFHLYDRGSGYDVYLP